MLVRLHSQATTTPKVRADIQASDEPAWVLADRHGTTEQTVYKWRHRDGVEDRSHTPHRLQTTLAPVQEAVAVALRKALLISLGARPDSSIKLRRTGNFGKISCLRLSWRASVPRRALGGCGRCTRWPTPVSYTHLRA